MIKTTITRSGNAFFLIFFLILSNPFKANAQCTNGDQTSYGTNEWIGYVYSNTGSSNPPANPFGGNYEGYITQSETFDFNLGSGAITGSNLCNSYSNNFAVRYKMQMELAPGYYTYTVGGDDGYRLSLDGGTTFNSNLSAWTEHGYVQSSATYYHSGGTISLVLEYFEAAGDSRVSFSYYYRTCNSTAPDYISGVTEVPSCNTTTTLTAEGGTHGLGSSYQWGTGSVIGSNIITNQTGQSITISPTATTTYWVRRHAAYECESYTDAATAKVTVVSGAAGDPSEFGYYSWNTYVYNGSNSTVDLSSLTYLGYYTTGTLGFDSDTSWNRNSNPSNASNWVGCTMNNDNFSFVYKRKGFPCGDYAFYLNDWDDRVRVYLNGTLIMSYDGWSGGAPASAHVLGNYYLNEDSEIEVRVAEDGGDANAQLDLTPLTVAPTAITAGTFLCKDTNITLTATGGTLSTGEEYQWGTGDTEGENIITGANSTTLTTNITDDTWYWVRIYNTECETYTAAATLQVAVPSPVTWNGTSWSATPTSETAIIVEDDLTISTDLTVCSCELTGTATLTVTEGTDFTVVGKLTVGENATMVLENKGSLLQEEEIANEGNISVIRNSSKIMRLDYTAWSSPVLGQEILDFSPETVTGRFYTLDPVQNIFTAISPSQDFEPGLGYLIRAPNTHPTTPTVYTGTFTGVPNNGTISLSLPYTGTAKSYSLIGNPYPSPIDIIAFINDNASVIEGTVWMWRKTNNPDETTYCTLTTLGFTANLAPGGTNEYSYDPDGVFNTAQGFFVNTIADGTVNFTNTMRQGNSSNQFFRTANNNSDTSRYWLNISGEEAEAFSQILIGYLPGATTGYDNTIDGRTFDDGILQFYSLMGDDDSKLKIQGRPDFNDADFVNIGYSAANAGTYEISLSNTDGIFADGQNIYLLDNFLEIISNVTENSYIFASEEGIFDDRFKVVYTTEALKGEVFGDSQQKVVLYTKDKKVVAAANQPIVSVILYDVTGRVIYESGEIYKNEFSSTDLYTGQQVIIANVTLQDKTVISKKIMVD